MGIHSLYSVVIHSLHNWHRSWNLCLWVHFFIAAQTVQVTQPIWIALDGCPLLMFQCDSLAILKGFILFLNTLSQLHRPRMLYDFRAIVLSVKDETTAKSLLTSALPWRSSCSRMRKWCPCSGSLLRCYTLEISDIQVNWEPCIAGGHSPFEVKCRGGEGGWVAVISRGVTWFLGMEIEGRTVY